MNRTPLHDLVSTTDNLATLPGTVVELLQVMMDATTCADEVARIVERDPAMTANILKLANSAFYGGRQEVATVRQALVRLGNRCVTTLAFTAGMAPVLRCDLQAYGLSRDQYWTHSLASAIASSEAVRRTGSASLGCEAFTAGLIHNVGMLILEPELRRAGVTISSSLDHDILCRREMEALGFDHCQAGAYLTSRWGFPDLLTDPVARHETGEGDGLTADVVRAVAAGQLMATTLYRDPEPDIEECLTPLGFGGDLLEVVRDGLEQDLESTLIRLTRPQPVGAV